MSSTIAPTSIIEIKQGIQNSSDKIITKLKRTNRSTSLILNKNSEHLEE